LVDFVTDAGVDFRPGDLVFQEAASTLYDKEDQKIARW
jgi:hypothetical protein